MGLHICVQNNRLNDLPAWDFVRLAGDREFVAMMDTLPGIEKSWGIRPTDFDVWREAVASRQWDNPGRFEQLLDLLEDNPDYAIHVSW